MQGSWFDFAAGDAVNPYTGKIYARYPFSAFWLVNGEECALSGAQKMNTFIAVPQASTICTMLYSSLHETLVGREMADKSIVEVLGFSNSLEASRVPEGQEAPSEVKDEKEAAQQAPSSVQV